MCFVTSACFKSLQLFWLTLVIERLYILKKLEKVVLYWESDVYLSDALKCFRTGMGHFCLLLE